MVLILVVTLMLAAYFMGYSDGRKVKKHCHHGHSHLKMTIGPVLLKGK